MLLHGDTPREITDFSADLIQDAMQTEAYQEFERDSLLHLREAYMGPDE